jgi:hypothetical protein
MATFLVLFYFTFPFSSTVVYENGQVYVKAGERLRSPQRSILKYMPLDSKKKKKKPPDWPSYYREVYCQRDTTNEIQKQKKLPLEIGPIFYHETVEFFFKSVLDLGSYQEEGDINVLLFLFLLSRSFTFTLYLMYVDLTRSVLMYCVLFVSVRR